MVLNGKEVEVIIEKKRIKNIYFRINENGQVYVTCPKLVSKIEINRLLEKNKSSLEKMYNKYESQSKKKEKILYLGNELDFVKFDRIMFQDNMAFGPSVDKINAYLEKNCLSIFQKRMDLYIGEFNNLPKFRLRVRKMKTRWGVCNRGSMTVTLNTQLIHKRAELIDYVIVHELSHFDHMDHSKYFWSEVEKHYPNYKKARKELSD